MYQPLELAKGSQPARSKRTYEYRLIDEKTAEIQITTENDCVRTLVDVDILDRMKREVTQLYIFRNAADDPYIMLGLKGGGKSMIGRWIMGVEGNEVVDHMNGNPLDNRRQNLRVVTRRVNMRNRKKFNKYGLRGVSRSNGKWVARITIGTYDTKEEAHAAFMEAYEKLFPGILLQEE